MRLLPSPWKHRATRDGAWEYKPRPQPRDLIITRGQLVGDAPCVVSGYRAQRDALFFEVVDSTSARAPPRMPPRPKPPPPRTRPAAPRSSAALSARCAASALINAMQVLLQRPPVSHASTTSLQRADATISGYVTLNVMRDDSFSTELNFFLLGLLDFLG